MGKDNNHVRTARCVSCDQGGRFPPFSADFLKQLFTLSRVYDGIPFVIMRLPHSNSFKCARTIELLYGTYSSTEIQRKLRHAFALQRSNDVIMLMYADYASCLRRTINQSGRAYDARPLFTFLIELIRSPA